MIKKFAALFLSSLILFVIVSGTILYSLYAFKLFIGHGYVIALFVVAVSMYIIYGIVDTLKLTQLETAIDELIDHKLNAHSNLTTVDADKNTIKLENINVTNLTYKTTDLTLYEYSVRAQFVEVGDPISRMGAICSYLNSRIIEDIDFTNVPLPIVLELIKICDENIPETSKSIIYDNEPNDSAESELFDDMRDIDTDKIN